MAVINKYTAHTIEPDILSRLNVDQAGDVVSAETWVALWDLVLHLLAKYNEHFVDIYRTLEELGTEVDTCIKRIDSLEDQYQSLEERMGNLETSWSALQDAYNKVAGHYEEIKHIQESLESGFVHYGEEPPATDFIKLWVMPTQGIPSLITSWGENDILATNYNYASAKLIKDSLNTKVNKAGDTMTGTLSFSGSNHRALYGGNPAYREWYVNWDGDFKLWTGNVGALDVGGRLWVGGSQHTFTINPDRSDPSVTLHNLRLTGLQHPTMPDDAAPRRYVDDTRDLNVIPSTVINDWTSGRLYKSDLYYADAAAQILYYRTDAGDTIQLPDETLIPKALFFKSNKEWVEVEPDGVSKKHYAYVITVFNSNTHCEVLIDRITNVITVQDYLKPTNDLSKNDAAHFYPTAEAVKGYVDSTQSDMDVTDKTDPAFIKNKTHGKMLVENNHFTFPHSTALHTVLQTEEGIQQGYALLGEKLNNTLIETGKSYTATCTTSADNLDTIVESVETVAYSLEDLLLMNGVDGATAAEYADCWVLVTEPEETPLVISGVLINDFNDPFNSIEKAEDTMYMAYIADPVCYPNFKATITIEGIPQTVSVYKPLDIDYIPMDDVLKQVTVELDKESVTYHAVVPDAPPWENQPTVEGVLSSDFHSLTEGYLYYVHNRNSTNRTFQLGDDIVGEAHEQVFTCPEDMDVPNDDTCCAFIINSNTDWQLIPQRTLGTFLCYDGVPEGYDTLDFHVDGVIGNLVQGYSAETHDVIKIQCVKDSLSIDDPVYDGVDVLLSGKDNTLITNGYCDVGYFEATSQNGVQTYLWHAVASGSLKFTDNRIYVDGHVISKPLRVDASDVVYQTYPAAYAVHGCLTRSADATYSTLKEAIKHIYISVPGLPGSEVTLTWRKS